MGLEGVGLGEGWGSWDLELTNGGMIGIIKEGVNEVLSPQASRRKRDRRKERRRPGAEPEPEEVELSRRLQELAAAGSEDEEEEGESCDGGGGGGQSFITPHPGVASPPGLERPHQEVLGWVRSRLWLICSSMVPP